MNSLHRILCAILLISVCGRIMSYESSGNCPSECKVCFRHHLACTDGGLREIPTQLYTETTKITLIGHTFDGTVLARHNFSIFSKPKYKLEQLSIRKSNIEVIEPNTFYDLMSLDNLDLSNNFKIIIRYMAFANLKLKHLKLDNIEHLDIQSGAFEDMMVYSLSIINSRLKTLEYQLMRPIVPELYNLFLSKNQLTYLEPKFEKFFQKLIKLQLTNNPWRCSCNLAWLGKVLQQRLKKSQSIGSTFSYSETMDNYPKCMAPLHVINRFIHNVSHAEFSCEPPVFDTIDVYFEQPNLVRLSCSATLAIKRAPIQIFWQQISHKDTVTYPNLKSISNNKAVALVKKDPSIAGYKCFAKSDNGNATIKITIKWPTEQNHTNPNSGGNSENEWKKKTILTKTLSKSYFFREQFTLLELLGAIFGTFIITLIIFLIIYKLYFRSADIKFNPAPNKKPGYTIYETGVYSDSQTYDIPHNNNNNNNNNNNAINPNYPNYTQTLLNKSNIPINTPSHFIDYRTQQKITSQ